jgi:hypothetical protein
MVAAMFPFRQELAKADFSRLWIVGLWPKAGMLAALLNVRSWN